MRYRVARDLTFFVEPARPEVAVLAAGELVEEVRDDAMSPTDRREVARMRRQAQAADGAARLIAFEWRGRVRTAVAGRDVVAATPGLLPRRRVAAGKTEGGPR